MHRATWTVLRVVSPEGTRYPALPGSCCGAGAVSPTSPSSIITTFSHHITRRPDPALASRAIESPGPLPASIDSRVSSNPRPSRSAPAHPGHEPDRRLPLSCATSASRPGSSWPSAADHHHVWQIAEKPPSTSGASYSVLIFLRRSPSRSGLALLARRGTGTVIKVCAIHGVVLVRMTRAATRPDCFPTRPPGHQRTLPPFLMPFIPTTDSTP